MARLQGISGGLSGKMGSVVFRQRGGETIATQYQPQIKNPNTEGQQTSRAAFKLITQLAAIMAPGFGTLGVTKRGGHAKPSQRNGFTQLNYPLIETASEEGVVVAKIPMEQLKLTSSMRVYGEMEAAALTDGIDVTIEVLDSAIASGRIILVGYASMGVAKQAQIREIIDVPVNNNTISHSFSNLPEGDYTVLSFGLIPTETTDSSVSLDNIHTPADEDYISAVKLDLMVRDGQMAETTTIGANVSIA